MIEFGRNILKQYEVIIVESTPQAMEAFMWLELEVSLGGFTWLCVAHSYSCRRQIISIYRP